MRSASSSTISKWLNVSDLATVKDFLWLYIVTNRGKINENNRPTADSAHTFTEYFFTGFTCIMGIPTDEAD